MKWEWSYPHNLLSKLVQVDKLTNSDGATPKLNCPVCGSTDQSWGQFNGPTCPDPNDLDGTWSLLCHDCGLYGISMREWWEAQANRRMPSHYRRTNKHVVGGRKYKVL